MSEYPKMPSKPVTPAGAAKQTTAKGAWGGGTAFFQQNLGQKFTTIKPIVGHTQKQNIKPA